MDFLKELLGEELFKQVEEKINAHNGDEANKDKLIKLANIASGDYVGKEKLDRLQETLTGKTSELDKANGLIAELQKGTKGNEDLQSKISDYETQVKELQAENAQKDIDFAFNLLLMDAGVKDAESREFLIYKHEKQLKEQGKALELDENKHIKGGKEIVENLKTANPTHFESGKGGRQYEPNPLPGGEDDRETEPKTLAEALKAEYEKPTE